MAEIGEGGSGRNGPSGSAVRFVWSVNLLCLIGAAMGLTALFAEWLYNPPTMLCPPGIRQEPTVIYMVANHYLYYGAAAAFLVGTLAAFLSPLGGILQSAGLAAFVLGVFESGDDVWLDGIDPQQELRIGMCMGAVSCILVVSSLFAPVGTGRLRPSRPRNIEWSDRLLTVSASLSK